MSNLGWQTGGMKTKLNIKRSGQTPLHTFIFPPTTIARFGRASLIRHFDGPYELVGGTAEERAAAREWCSLFSPQVVFSAAPENKATLALTA